MKRRGLILVLASAMTSTRLVHAQQKALPVIGYLSSVAAGPALTTDVAAFQKGLGETGYVEGRNVTIEYLWAEGHNDRLMSLAGDLVRRKVDVIVATNNAAIIAAKAVTSTIPIVFFGSGDFVAAGFVASLARPGGNLTGLNIFGLELNPKRLQLLSEVVPQAEVIALLVNPTNPISEATIHDVHEAAPARGQRISILKASTQSEIDAAFETLAPLNADGLFVATDPFFTSRREQLVALAARHAVPAIYGWREFADAGGLISYGASQTDTWRQVGVYVGRILAGAKPADLPIQQPTRFELVINLKTAKTLGITIPQSVLGRANELIE